MLSIVGVVVFSDMIASIVKGVVNSRPGILRDGVRIHVRNRCCCQCQSRHLPTGYVLTRNDHDSHILRKMIIIMLCFSVSAKHI